MNWIHESREKHKRYLMAFLAVARERSFTRAAAQLGVSQSALSHRIRGLEERLGLRRLTRITRSVATTEAGERLLRTVGPKFEQIDFELSALTGLREKPADFAPETTWLPHRRSPKLRKCPLRAPCLAGPSLR
jgi:DNA-binding transcriptional LysR family regulator